jgi:alpha 1,3-glucosidase
MKGYCWPGDSYWIDYFNAGAREFWASLYSFGSFLGTDESFHIWLDMNEPSVFNGPENTMSKDAYHVLSDGSKVLSKDLKNAYGRMMIEATF